MVVGLREQRGSSHTVFGMDDADAASDRKAYLMERFDFTPEDLLRVRLGAEGGLLGSVIAVV